MERHEGEGCAGHDGHDGHAGLAGGCASRASGVPSVAPAEARRLLAEAPADTLLLDVREPEELGLARVEGALAIPMHLLPLRLAEVPRERRILVLCHHGVRSWHVAQALLAHGWPRVANVAGGIERWALEADASVGRY